MELNGSKTEANLLAAFEDKALIKNLYDSFAYRCAYAGHQQIQNAMYDAAKLEGTHAKILYEFLYGPVKDTKTNMRAMYEKEVRIGEELHEAAKIAKEEGFEQAAKCFEDTANIHDEHIKVYEQIVYNFENDMVFNKSKKVDWVCCACGYIIHDRAPVDCPYCEHPKGLFYIRKKDF